MREDPKVSSHKLNMVSVVIVVQQEGQIARCVLDTIYTVCSGDTHTCIYACRLLLVTGECECERVVQDCRGTQWSLTQRKGVEDREFATAQSLRPPGRGREGGREGGGAYAVGGARDSATLSVGDARAPHVPGHLATR
jgi:hypothetical protein